MRASPGRQCSWGTTIASSAAATGTPASRPSIKTTGWARSFLRGCWPTLRSSVACRGCEGENHMSYRDLRDFLSQLERSGELKRVRAEVDPNLEMTEVCDRVLKSGGPALLFEKPKGHAIPVLGNLFGTTRRVALAMGADPNANPLEALRDIGVLLAFLKEPEPPRGFRDALERWIPIGKQVMHMAPKEVSGAACQATLWEGKDVDLSRLPIQTCWPEDAAPLITWGLTITRGPRKTRQNLGIYRQQVVGSNKLIMRWLPHRGGATDFP